MPLVEICTVCAQTSFRDDLDQVIRGGKVYFHCPHCGALVRVEPMPASGTDRNGKPDKSNPRIH